MCMSCSSKGGASSNKTQGRQTIKNWGGMNLSKGSRSSSGSYSKSSQYSNNFGTPKVRGSFGTRGK